MRRNLYLLVILAFLLVPLSNIWAQRVAPVKSHQLQPMTEKSAPPVRDASEARHGATNPAAAKTAAVSPISIGSAGNAFGTYIGENNTVLANDSTGVVAFIHRNNPNVNGGTNLELRYDISINRGLTWSTDIGPINPTGGSGRYPQIADWNAGGNTNPLAGRAIWLTDHLNGVNWTGFNVGSTEIVTSGTPATQDVILPAAIQSTGGAMSQGHRGEYWTARFSHDGLNYTDTLKIYKGVYNQGTQSVTWAQYSTKVMNWYTGFDGTPYTLTPSVSFSPDGNIGWIATLGDLVGGNDSVFSPILLKSTDGGTTWGNPVEVDLNSYPWVFDSLRSLWVDSLGAPASTGRAAGTFDYDLTVDAGGNPHLFFVMGSAGVSTNPAPGYSVYSGLAKYAVDLTSSNQGTNFDLRLVSPILTFRTMTFGTGSNYMDNYPQVSRTGDGSHIFYSWADTDTSLVTGSMLGVGFGSSDNSLPNLWIAGMRVSDGYFTCIHPVTQADLVWEGKAYFPQLAPEVLVTGSGPTASYRLPVVIPDMPTMEPADPAFYYYFGNDAVLDETDFSFSPGSTITWNGCGVNPGIAAYIRGKVYVDDNANNVFDGNDVAISGITVSTTGVINSAYTLSNGDYSIRCAPNTTYGLVAAFPNNGAWTQTLPTTPYSITPAPMSINNGYDIAIQPVGVALDLAIDVVVPSMRPGFATNGTIYVRNLGNQPTTGTVTFTYNPNVTLSGSTPTWASHNPGAYTATFTLPTIPVFQSAAIQLDLSIGPNVPLGTSLNFSGAVATTGQDVDGYNNQEAVNAFVIGSYDPNDKAATPAGVGANHQVLPGTELAYRIRFQNTGTASAINVVVRDTLDLDLDISTFKMLAASHSYTLTMENGRFLIWDFSGINLPDSFSNEPASHGYIDFSIRPKANLPLGTVVDNSAAIYFDFNAPVITNVASITYDLPIGVDPGVTAGSSLRIYPHPVGSKATIAYERVGNRPWALEILDLQGRVVYREGHVTTDTFEWDRGQIQSGLYLYKVTQAGSSPVVGRIVLQ